jgi:transposase
MRDRDLYAQILGIVHPWNVTHVELDPDHEQVEVHVEARAVKTLPCPECGIACTRYDHRTRRWRHLDTCQYRTILVAEVPRVECPEHGVHQVTVPWGDPGSRFTALFEALAIDWLKEASASAVARRLGMSWDEVDSIMQRAVQRGLKRRPPTSASRIGIDETSFQKRHEYVSVVSDLDDTSVLHVADDRKTESISGFFESLTPEQLAAIEVVAMDMWNPYITATRDHVPDADKKIAFDKFHVASHLGDAVDKVRRAEHRELMAQDDVTLKGTKYIWLQNPEKMNSVVTETALDILKRMALKTARAWAIKEHAMCLWNYARRGWAKKAWSHWYRWAIRSRLEPVKRVARMIRKHMWGIINAIVLRATNAGAESINAKIQKVKRMACGFRNRERFRTAIYFHLGGLDLYPATHTKP